MRIGIFIINYNGLKYLGEIFYHSLESFSKLKDKCGEIIDIWFIDNKSEDSSVEIAKRFGFKILVLPMNLGYGRAFNLAYRLLECQGIKYDIYILSNNDIILFHEKFCSHFIGILKKIMLKYPEFIGMPLLINGFDNKIDFGCNLISDIGKTFHLRYILTDAELLEKYLLDKYIFFIDCADGAFLIISNKTISKIGGLDNKMFMYFEDVDYSLRGWKNKIPSLLLPVVIGKHYRSSSTEKNKENIIYFEFLNNFLIVKRYFGIISLFKLIVWYLFLPFRTMYSNPTIVKNKYYIVLDQINLPKIVILKIFTLSLLNVFYKNNDKWGRILLPSVKISFKMMLASSELIKVVRGKYKYWLHNRLCYVG